MREPKAMTTAAIVGNTGKAKASKPSNQIRHLGFIAVGPEIGVSELKRRQGHCYFG